MKEFQVLNFESYTLLSHSFWINDIQIAYCCYVRGLLVLCSTTSVSFIFSIGKLMDPLKNSC